MLAENYQPMSYLAMLNQASRNKQRVSPLMAAGVGAALILVLSSCASMGPKTIPADGFNYNARIAMQHNEQILFNIVRLRYAEVPVFLNVSSVINQYSRDARVGGGATNLFGTPGASANVDAGWADRPTITYTPMSGQAFSQSLLTPVSPAILFFLVQSGSLAGRLMRMTASSINGLFNEVKNPRKPRPADPRFVELLGVMEKLQYAGVLGMDVGGTEAEPTIDIYFPEQISSDSVRVSLAQFKQLLNLDPASNRFTLRYGMIQETRNEIVVQSLSMLEILLVMSWSIDVPPEHVAEGRTLSTFQSDSEPLIQISSSKDQPDYPFAAIKIRNYWYYIDDRNLDSKTAFATIQILLSLAKDGSQARGPLISIGN